MGMTKDELHALAHRWIEEIFNEQRIEAVDELYSRDYQRHDAQGIMDFQTFREANKAFYHAFPDLKYQPTHIVAEDDLLVIRWTGKGTFANDLVWGTSKFAPTQKEFSVVGTDTLRVSDGKIVESWSSLDTLFLWSQVIPARGEAVAKSGQ